MGYQMNSGRWADTEEVVLLDDVGLDESGEGDAVELGDRSSLRLTLDVREVAFAGTNEVQSVTVSDATDGTYTLSFDGDATGPLDHDADALVVQAALEQLASVGAGNVECSVASPGVIHVEFVNGLGSQNVAQLVADDALLVGVGAAAVVATVTPGVAGSGTLDIAVQTSADGETGWVTLGSFTQATGVGSQRKVFSGLDRFVRATATVSADDEFTVDLFGEAV